MRFSRLLWVAGLAIGAPILFAACSGVNSQGMPLMDSGLDRLGLTLGGEPAASSGASLISGQRQRFVESRGLSPVVYISASSNYDFYALAYSTHQPYQLVCSDVNQNTAADTVNTIEVDKSGVLWVPAQNSNGYPGDHDRVYSYGPNCGNPGITLKAPTNGGPVGIAFGNRGTNYVLMFPKFGGLPFVSVYPKGQTTEKRSRRLKNPTDLPGTWGIGADSHGNVYVIYGKYASEQGAVIEYPNGRGPGSQLNMQLTGVPFGVIFDKKDNMIVPNVLDPVVDIYAPPYTGTATAITLLARASECSLNRRGTLLACSELGQGSSGPTGTVDFYSYPAGGYEFSVTIPASYSPSYGVAFSPADPQ
jgi:hypothetical protein